MSPPKAATLEVTPFKAAIPEASVDELITLVKLSKLPPPSYEGGQDKYGVTSAWMRQARDQWLSKYNWY